MPSSARFKRFSLQLVFLLIPCFIYAQTVIFKGVVRDVSTLKPVQDVNIKVHKSVSGTSTGIKGDFSLEITRIPATLIITCVGYESIYYDVTDEQQVPVEFLLTPKSYPLREVDISSRKYSYLFKDKDYSVLDYELMDDNILLLVFRNQLSRSELVLLNRTGDTLATSKLPEVPPAALYKDFLANVHYFSRAGNAYQCFFKKESNRIEFINNTSVDSLISFIKPFIFEMSGRLYFQESLANGFGTAVGFYEEGGDKIYIRKHLSEKKMAEFADDQAYYQRWNGNAPSQHYFMTTREDEFYTGPEFDFSSGELSGQYFETNEARANLNEFYNLIYPVIKIGENRIAFFDFSADLVELMDENGNITRNVPVKFHKGAASTGVSANSPRLSNTGWRWGRKIMADDDSRDLYTIFLRNGMVKVQKIDLETGKLNVGTVLPFPFPEKIEIYKGDAYFLVRNDGSNENWKLAKMKL